MWDVGVCGMWVYVGWVGRRQGAGARAGRGERLGLSALGRDAGHGLEVAGLARELGGCSKGQGGQATAAREGHVESARAGRKLSERGGLDGG